MTVTQRLFLDMYDSNNNISTLFYKTVRLLNLKITLKKLFN